MEALMPGPITMEFSPSDPTPRNALRTLVDIQRYVDSRKFGLFGLARGLRRENERTVLLGELVWLTQNGYVTGSPSAQMELTQKGRSFEEASENDEEEVQPD